MRSSKLLLGMALLLGAAAAVEPESKTISAVLREPLPPENLSCIVTDSAMTVEGPTFRYVIDRATGAVAELEVAREGRIVAKLREPAALWLDDFNLAKSACGVTQVLAEGTERISLLTKGQWCDGVACSIRNTVYNDGVLVSEISITPEADLVLRQGIRHDIEASGRFTHYLHKRRDNEGMDCFQGTLPQPGETVRLHTPTSCLEVFSTEAALAMFTDMGDSYRSPDTLDTAAVRVDTHTDGECVFGIHQHLIHASPEGAPYTLPAGETFTFRVGLAVAPNRLPHPRWRDLRMFIWVGDEKYPYPTDDEIRAAARLGFTMFQMHRLGPPGEPRPPAEELSRVIKTVHEAGMLFIWTANADLQYAHTEAVAALVAEGKWSQWQGFNYGGRYRATMDGFCNTLATCLASPNGLDDYRIECTTRMMERYAVDGMYIDDNLAYANCTLWKEHGHPQQTYDCLIELHDMNWRRRQALREKCPHAVLIDHCSRAFVLPVIAPFDCHLFGEGYSFPSIEAFRATFGSFSNMYAQGCLFAGDSEPTRCAAETAYAFDLLTGGGQYCYLDWRLWPDKFPYAAGVHPSEPLFVKTYNLAQYDFGLYESDPPMELATTLPGTFSVLYYNRVWNETLLVIANMNTDAATCALAAPDVAFQSVQGPAPIAIYDLHQRNVVIASNAQEAAPCFEAPLRPSQMRLLHLRRVQPGAAYHQWGGKRISEQWDATARKLTLRLHGPAGLEQWIVLGTGGTALGQVMVDAQPAAFFCDPERGLAYGKVTFGREPVLLEASTVTDDSALPQQPIPPSELAAAYP